MRSYWDFDTGRSIRLGSWNEYAEAYREVFERAVRRRVRSGRPVAISVSGGLDSSSIFCQAETLRSSRRADCPAIAGITYIGGAGTEADERRYVEAIELKYGTSIERIDAEPLMGVARDIEEQIAAAEAPFVDYLWGLTRQLHQRAVAGGARVLLTGHWGDQVLFSSAYLVDLFRQLAWLDVRRHIRQYVKWFGEEETRALVRRFAVDLGRHHLPTRFIAPLKWVRRRWLGVERPKPWFADGFLRRALRLANRPATLGKGFRSAHAQAIYVEARSKYYVHCLEWHNKIGARHGLDAAFPFLDRDLLAFVMAVPGEIQARNGVARALAREAMRGVLPDCIYARTTKADFSRVVNRGVAGDVPLLMRALSSDCLGVRLGYLDRDRLSPAVARLSAGLMRPDCLDSWDLADVLGLETWLRLFHGGVGESQTEGNARAVQEAALSAAGAYQAR
jgi:asparagine synthase (glutamine-hydrolysing)